MQHLAEGDFIAVLAEGESDTRLILEDKETPLSALQPYYLMGKP